MPVQKWDHVTDPLDVDKKKHKAALLHKQIETPFMAIKETENENDETFSQASNQQSLKAFSEQKSAAKKSMNQQPLRTNSSIQLMSDMYTNPITTDKMTLVNNVPAGGLAKTYASQVPGTQHASPERSAHPEKKFSQTQDLKAIQRFNTTNFTQLKSNQFSSIQKGSIKSISKEIPAIKEQKGPKPRNQNEKGVMNENQISQVVHMYDDEDSSDDYSLTDLKAQFEEQQKDVRGDLVSLINNKKEQAKNEVLAKLQSTSTRKYAEDTSQNQMGVEDEELRRQKTNMRQLTEQAVHATKPAGSYRSDASRSLMSQAGFKEQQQELTADEPTAEAEDRSWFERQNPSTRATPKAAPFTSARQAAPDLLTEHQLQQIHQYMRKQQQPDDIRSLSNQSKTSKAKQDLQQWETTQQLIQKEKDLQNALDELERERQEIQAQKQALSEFQLQQKQSKMKKPLSRDRKNLTEQYKAQLTFGFGDNLEKALEPEDLDSQKNFTQTKRTQEMHEEQQKKLKQKQLLVEDNEKQEKIFRQQSQQYETDMKQKRQFQALNSTQKVFPSLRAGHSLFVGGVLTRDDSELDHKSIRTQGAVSTGSNKKIGGLARRKYSNQMAKIGSKRTLRNDFESERIEKEQNNQEQVNESYKVNQSNYQDRSESIEKEEKYVSSAQIEPNHTQTHSSRVASHGHQTNHTQQNCNNELGEQAMSQPPDLKIPDIRSNNSPQAPDSLSKKSNAKLQQIKEQMNMLQAEIVKMDNPTPPKQSLKADTEATPAQRQELDEPALPAPSGIEIQTQDLNPNLRMQIRRSRRSFQNQVYLEDSQDQLKSTISNYTEKVKKKHAEEQQQLYQLKKQQILDNLNQIKLYEKEIQEMEMELQEEDQETEKQFPDKRIAHKEGERAIQTNIDEISKATEQNPMILMQDQCNNTNDKGNDPRARDAQTDAKARDAETEAKARDVALDPMICEKSTDPRMVDKQIGAWKRDGVMQTSKESKILKDIRDSQIETNTVKAVNESFIKKQKPSIKVEHKGSTASPFFRHNGTQQLVNNGGTQYSLDVAVNTKKNGPINQEEQDLLRQRESFDKTVELVDNDSRSQLIEQNQVMDMAIQPGSLDKKPRSDSHSVRKSTQKSGKLQDSMMVNDQLRNVLIDSQNMENSPLLQHDFDKESEGLPIYHDHLIEEILNQKVKNLREYQARSREKVRNDSRSTQQMFEHQFGMGKQKERFQSVKQGINKASHLSSPVPSNNINFIGHQNQQPSMFKPLPPIIQERESIQQFEPHIHPNTVKQSNPKLQFKSSTMYSDPTSIAGGQMKFSNQNSNYNGSIQFQNPNNYQSNYYDEAANCEICRNQQQMSHQHQHHALGQYNLGRAGSRSFGQRHQSLPAVHHGNHGGNQFQPHQHHHGHHGAPNSPMLPPSIFQNGGNMYNQNGFQNPGQQYESRNRGFTNNTQAQSYLNQNFGQQQNEFGQWGSNQNQERSPPFPSAPFAGLNLTQENSRQNLYEDGLQRQLQPENTKQQHPLKHFKGQDLEMYYMEKKLKPEVEKEIKKGFFEIRKKFNQDDQHAVQTARGGMLTQTNDADEEVQVYVSHICLQNYHPIFCKMNVDTVKLILKYSQIVYLKKGQTLYAPGFNESNFYVILFGKCKLNSSTGSQRQIGNVLNIGWTIGEEILFKTQEQKAEKKKYQRNEICQAVSEACVLGVKKKNLTQIKKCLYEKNAHEEFSKIEIVLRGNHLVKKDWF